MLAHGKLYSDATLTYTDVDQTDIAWGLVDYTQTSRARTLASRKAGSGSA